jgi:hypothetical protein
LLLPLISAAQTEPIRSQPIGMDTRLVFPHVSVPGAGVIDFSFGAGFSPLYAPEESHTVVMVFEWGPTAAGPWSTSPDFVNTVPGGMTDLYSTGVHRAAADAPFVALHFYAGGLMIVSGDFAHISAVPEPRAALLFAAGLIAVLAFRLHVRRYRTTR